MKGVLNTAVLTATTTVMSATATLAMSRRSGPDSLYGSGGGSQSTGGGGGAGGGGGGTGDGGGSHAVPEIDVTTGVLAIAAVTAGLMLAYELRRRRQHG